MDELKLVSNEEQKSRQIQEDVMKFLEENPEKAAEFVKIWLSEGGYSLPESSEPEAIESSRAGESSETVSSCPTDQIADIIQPSHESRPLGIQEILQSLNTESKPIPAEIQPSAESFLCGDSLHRESIYLDAFQGSVESQRIISDLAMRGHGHAIVYLLRANLLDDRPMNLWRSDDRLISLISRSLLREYPENGPVTIFIRNYVKYQSHFFIGFLINGMIQSHDVSIHYSASFNDFPVVLNKKRKIEGGSLLTQRMDSLPDSKPLSGMVPPVTHDSSVREEVESPPFLEFARIIAMIHIHTPVIVRKYFGSLYDWATQRISVLFELWTEDPVVAHAFCVESQFNYSNRQRALNWIEEAICNKTITPETFNYNLFPGFMEDILPELSIRQEAVKVFAQQLNREADQSSGETINN